MTEQNTSRTSPAIAAVLACISAVALALGTMGATAPLPKAQQDYTTRTVKVRLPAPTRKAEPPRHGIGRRDIDCIASAIWHEAGNQPREGRIAVAEVVIARTRSGRYPNKACGVVAQRRQFSFVEGGRIPAVPSKHREEMLAIANGVAAGILRSRVRGAMWFHATYVDPDWDEPVIGRIGSHIFYGART